MALDWRRHERWRSVLARAPTRRARHRPGHVWFGPMIASAIGLLGLAELAERAAEPTAADHVTLTALAGLGLLGLLAGAAGGMIACAQSPDRHVFHAGRISVCGLTLACVGVALAGVMTHRGPFDHLVSTFRVGAADVADLGLLVAVVICVITSVCAWFDAADARRRERRWSDHLGTG